MRFISIRKKKKVKKLRLLWGSNRGLLGQKATRSHGATGSSLEIRLTKVLNKVCRSLSFCFRKSSQKFLPQGDRGQYCEHVSMNNSCITLYHEELWLIKV